MEFNSESWSSAVFRIVSENLSIEEISSMLSIQPTRQLVKGELSSKRNPNSRIREENILIFENEIDENESLEVHIEHFLIFLRENQENIKKLKSECEFDIMCSYSSENGQGGFTLSHNILKELSDYPVELIVSLYPPDGTYKPK